MLVNALTDTSVSAAVAAIRQAGGVAEGVRGDVLATGDVQAILGRASDRFGRADILYNNAGIGYSATARMGVGMADTIECSETDWRRTLDINLTGVFLVCRFGIPTLIEGGGGVVINTASIGALRGARNAHAYMASKAGIISLTRSIAVTYGAQRVRANTICPGPVDTDMIQDTMLPTPEAREAISAATPLGRVGLPEDVANMALFLASDAACFVTGQTLVVDGGLTA